MLLQTLWMVQFGGVYQLNSTFDHSKLAKFTTNGYWYSVGCFFLLSQTPADISSIVFPYACYLSINIGLSDNDFYIRLNANYKIRASDKWLDYEFYREGSTVYTGGTICFNGRVPYAFKLFLEEFATKLYVGDYNAGYQDGYNDGYKVGYNDGEEFGYNDGYSKGYDRGYEVGYNSGSDDGYASGYNVGNADGYETGYSNGLNKGLSASLTNPISSFIKPVHDFMNTEFFGTLTYASVFNVVLFVTIAIIFIKMFSGG